MKTIAITLLALATFTGPVFADEKPITRLAFGSCARQFDPQPIWDAVVATNLQLFIFLGDNIYGDSEDIEVLRAKYEALGKQPGYRKLKATCPVLATWDDHDYGVNDGGAEYPLKRASQQLFLDFFDVPQTDPRRQQEGVYSSHVYGPPGKRVQIILLDTRYFRSPLKRGAPDAEEGEGFRGIYVPDTDPQATVLGEAQWKWLAEQLKVPAELRIIGSSIQVIPNEHGFEKWGNFPRERQRLFDLIHSTQANGVVLISGDRHLAEVSRIHIEHDNPAVKLDYPLYEVTSSSLNAPSGNKTAAGTRFANEINTHAVGRTYFDTNFGSITIDWEAADPVVRMRVHDEKGGIVLQQRMPLSSLQPKTAR